MNTSNIQVGATIKALRQKDGWRLGDFARSLDITHGYMSNIEAGRKPCTPQLARRIADQLGVPLVVIRSGNIKPERVLSATEFEDFVRKIHAATSADPWDRPCTLTEAMRFARILRKLLGALDREIVDTAIFGESLADLTDTERQEVNRVRNLLHRRIGVRTEPSDLRARSLAILDSLADEFPSSALHDSSPCSLCGASTVGDADWSAGPVSDPSTNQANGGAA